MTLEKPLLLDKSVSGRSKLASQIDDHVSKWSLLTASEFATRALPVARRPGTEPG